MTHLTFDIEDGYLVLRRQIVGLSPKTVSFSTDVGRALRNGVVDSCESFEPVKKETLSAVVALAFAFPVGLWSGDPVNHVAVVNATKSKKFVRSFGVLKPSRNAALREEEDGD